MHKVQLGLKENWKQFTILVVVNAFVGGMVGLERTILPAIAEVEFAIAAKSAVFSFIVVFGITKAITNYYAGAFANKIGRRNLLLIGWLFAIPVPLLLMYAPNWNWVVLANVFLGLNQGLAWSSTVVMKMDLVGKKDRGFAMGLNEFAGYLSVAVVAFVTGWIASNYGIRPYPFYVGIGLTIIGLITTLVFVKDTVHHVAMESEDSAITRLSNVFLDTTFRNKNLSAVTQAGLVNNLNDGMVWGVLPILLSVKGFNMGEIGVLTAVYPGVWGVGQLFTGKMSDKFPKRIFLFVGMVLQALALFALSWSTQFNHYILCCILLGWGTAMVYPTFLSAIAAHTHPQDRAKSVGVYRLWRDMGYAIGAILTGWLADFYNLNFSIIVIAIVTLISAGVLLFRMDK